MQLFFPFIDFLAAATSVVLLVMLVAAGELRPRGLAAVVAWFVGAAACQFLARSEAMAAAGLALQTLLAVVLTVRWRLAG